MINKSEVSELFHLSIDDRKVIIEEGVSLLLMETKLLSSITSKKFNKILSEVIFKIEKQKEIELNNENYELVWYYDELVWGVQDKIKNLKKE
jgi:hypothetical protein